MTPAVHTALQRALSASRAYTVARARTAQALLENDAALGPMKRALWEGKVSCSEIRQHMDAFTHVTDAARQENEAITRYFNAWADFANAMLAEVERHKQHIKLS